MIRISMPDALWCPVKAQNMGIELPKKHLHSLKPAIPTC